MSTPSITGTMDLSSEVDIMATQYDDPTQASQDSKQVVPKHTYSWVVLFHWTDGMQNPFQLYPLSKFSGHEIRDAWITSQLVAKSRCRKMKPLACFPGQYVSMFAKMERGAVIFLFFY